MNGFGERVMTWLPAEEEGALTSTNQMKTRAADGSSVNEAAKGVRDIRVVKVERGARGSAG